MDTLPLPLKLSIANLLPVKMMLPLLCNPSYRPLKNIIEGRKLPILAVKQVVDYMSPGESIDDCIEKLLGISYSSNPLEPWRFHSHVESMNARFKASDIQSSLRGGYKTSDIVRITSDFLRAQVEIIDSQRNGRELEVVYNDILNVTNENEVVQMTISRLEKEAEKEAGLIKNKRLLKYKSDIASITKVLGISTKKVYTMTKMDIEVQSNFVKKSCEINEVPIIFETEKKKRIIFEFETDRKPVIKRSRDGEAAKINPRVAALCGTCSRKYNTGEFWIGCGICKRRYHGNCVKVTPTKAKRNKNFKCFSCMKRGL